MDPISDAHDSSLPIYLRWCTAKIAERFLALSPDEVWRRASAELPDERSPPLSYPETVQVLTISLFRELDLPDFPTWVARYRTDPAAYDREIASLALPTDDEPGER